MKRVFVALDFETSGLNPFHDSIIEIGAVKFSFDGEILETFETLVYSENGPGRTDIHGIDELLIRNAPQFDEILPHFVDFINGSTLVVHNAAFDLPFLRAELERLQVNHQPLSAICTLQLSRREHSLKVRKLADCCLGLGIPILEGHRALNDAMMASGVFRALASHLPMDLPEPVGIALPISAYANRSAPWPRPSTSVGTSLPEWTLGSRISQLPIVNNEDGPSVSAVDRYLSLLRDVLGDRVLTASEVDSLFDLADSLNLSRSEVRTIHSTFVSEVCKAALSDGFVSQQERGEISQLASVLDVGGWEEILDQNSELLRGAGQRVISIWNRSDGYLPSQNKSAVQRISWDREEAICESEDLSTRLLGRSVVITGEFTQFSREDGRKAILRRGGKAPGSVSRKTFAVVVGDSAGPSKIERCIEYGIPMLSYEEFCDLLDTGRLL